MLLRTELGIRRWRELNGLGVDELPKKVSIPADDEDRADAIMWWLSGHFYLDSGVGKSQIESCDSRYESKNKVDESWLVTMYAKAVESVSVLANASISDEVIQEIYEGIYSGNGNIDL